jgi:dTDP-4-amino-4,6-dideoxygalactose transaminase
MPDVLIPVHFAGLPADLESIAQVAGKTPIIEDACHAIGAERKTALGWSRVGACQNSIATVFSFHPVKPMTTAEGGAVLTMDEGFAREVRMLRSHGVVRDPSRQAEEGGWFYEMQALGYNYRITDVQAALGLAQLGRLTDGIARRGRLAALYRELLADLEEIAAPPDDQDAHSAWHLFPVRVLCRKPSRREVYEALHHRGIRAQVHYIPIHLQPYYKRHFGFRQGQFPAAETYYSQELSLPLFASMTEDDARRVARALHVILGAR